MRYLRINSRNGQRCFLKNVKKDAYGVEGGHDGDVVLGCVAADECAVACRADRVDITGIDDIRDMTLSESACDLVGILLKLLHNVGTNAVFLEELRCSRGCLDIEAEVVEAANERKCFFLILIRDGCEYGAVILKLHARCLKCLIECAVELIVISDRLTGGLHLGREVSIKSAELVEGEYGHLNVPTLLLLGVDVEDTLLLEALAEDYLGRDVSKAVAGCLREEGNGTRGTGVDLDDVYVVVLVNDELNVVKTYDADAETELLCILKDDSLDLVGNREGGYTLIESPE